MSVDFARLENQYVRDIQAQPAALAATLDGLAPSPELLQVVRRAQVGSFGRVVLTGMGGSYHVLVPLQLELIAGGWNCFLVETSELLHSMPRLLDKRPLVIALSQSGRSVELVRLAAQPRSGMMIAVTNTPGSPLAEQADAVVLMRAGEEYSVSCKTSIASLAALRWLGELLRGSDLDRTKRELREAVPAVQSYVSRWREHVSQLVKELEGVGDVFLLGRGASLAAAGLGGCIIKEAAHFHSEGMSAAAFRHGPFEMLSERVFVGIYAGEPSTAPLAHRLANDVRSAGARAAVIDQAAEAEVFRLPEVPAGVRPIVELLPPQMMSVALAAMRGHSPGIFRRITKVTTVE